MCYRTTGYFVLDVLIGLREGDLQGESGLETVFNLAVHLTPFSQYDISVRRLIKDGVQISVNISSVFDNVHTVSRTAIQANRFVLAKTSGQETKVQK